MIHDDHKDMVTLLGYVHLAVIKQRDSFITRQSK